MIFQATCALSKWGLDLLKIAIRSGRGACYMNIPPNICTSFLVDGVCLFAFPSGEGKNWGKGASRTIH